MKKLEQFNADYSETKLANGVSLYSYYKSNSPVYFRVYFYAGSQFDGDKPGLAHFCEHMLVGGTEKYPTKDILNMRIQEIGAKRNAFTNKKNLWLTFDLADRADLPDLFEIVDQVLNKSIFNSDLIEIERKVILAEQSRKISNPSQFILDLSSSLLFQNTNLESPILGNDGSVKNISRDDLIEYRDKYISNGRVAYFIAGDFDLNEVTTSLNKINQFREQINVSPDELAIITDKKILAQDISNPEQNYINLAARIAPINDKLEKMAGDMFNRIFGQGLTSRLFVLLRNRYGLVYGINSSLISNSEYATFTINTNCKVADTEKVIGVVKEELSKIIQDGINQTELDRARKNILRDIKFESESASYLVTSQMMKEITGQISPILPDEYIEIVKSVEIADVNNFIKKYLTNIELLTAGIGDFKFLNNVV